MVSLYQLYCMYVTNNMGVSLHAGKIFQKASVAILVETAKMHTKDQRRFVLGVVQPYLNDSFISIYMQPSSVDCVAVGCLAVLNIFCELRPTAEFFSQRPLFFTHSCQIYYMPGSYITLP